MATDYCVKVREEGSTGFRNIHFRSFAPVYVEIYYKDLGLGKHKDLLEVAEYKAWDYIKRLIKKKAFQDAADDADSVTDPIKFTFSNQGVGGRFKWGVRATEVYDPSMEAVVEKYYDINNAVLISPDSWLDEQLQKAYNARRNGSEEETNEQQVTS